MKPKVALVKGGSRRENIARSLQLLGDDINLTGVKNLFIKVNLISRDNQLGATHVDGVRALLQFLRGRYQGKITITEGLRGTAQVIFDKLGYPPLIKEFGVEFFDLHNGDFEVVEVYDANLQPLKLHFSKQIIESDYRIAIGPPKTHDVVGATLSIKNLAMGALADNGDKGRMHQGHPVHNLNLYLLAKMCPLQLSINDGFTGMENDGPIRGTGVDWGVAVSSCSPVAADCLAAQLMGFDINDIGYLWYLQKMGLGVSAINEMNIIGDNPRDCYRQFRPHSTFEEQRNWRDERVSKLLGI
jgi:uncharacterized protein (DUF362 family)